MSHQLDIVELLSGPHETPFVVSPSFNDSWWMDPSAPQGRNVRYLAFAQGQLEVARARIFDPAVIPTPFDGFDAYLPTIEIDRLETRVELRRNGYGLVAVDLIRSAFPHHQVVAFSHEDDFWNETGFHQKNRTDRRTDGYASFFVAPPLR